MKIILLGRFNPSEKFSGPEKAARSIYEQCTLHNLEAIFVEYFFDGRKYSFLKKMFGNEVSLHGKLRVLRKGIIPFVFFLLKNKPDLVHILTFERFEMIAVWYCIISKSRLIYNVHGVAAYENRLRRKSEYRFEAWKTNYVEKRIFRNSDLLIFPSQLARETAKYFYNNLSNECIIPHGIDIRVMDSPVIKKQIGPLRAVFVGEYARTEKGLQFLIDSLSGNSADLYLTVIGDKCDSIKFNKNKRTIFIDRVSHNCFLDLLRSNDLYISASNYDSFSISTLEAMVLGLIPIITTATGLSEYLQDGKNSFIFRYGDAERLRKIVKLLDDNRELVVSASGAAKEFARGYSWGSIFKKFYLPLYEISSKKQIYRNESTFTRK